MRGFVSTAFFLWHSFCYCDEAKRSAALSAEELASPKVIDYTQGDTTLWKAGRWLGLRVRAVDGIQARRLLATIGKPLSVRQGAVETMGAGKAQWILWD
jgi:hypothetical protein